jgi:serine protease AprX
MKYILFISIYLLGISSVLSQNTYILFFKNKKQDYSVYLNNKEKRLPLDFYDLPVSSKYLNELKLNNKIKSSSKWLNATLINSNYSVAEIYTKYTFIKDVIQLKSNKKKKNTTSINRSYSNRTIDSNLYNFSYNQLEITQTASCLHNDNYKGDGVIIAVLDAGFPEMDSMSSFTRLRNENRIIDTWDFEDNLPFVYHKVTHGTFVSSIITGEIDSTFIGSAPNASFAFYVTEIASVEVNQEEYNLVLGLERADSIGADIASISLGYRDFDSLQTSYGYAGMDGYTTIAAQGVKIARDKGMIIVVAAGNKGTDGFGSLVSPCDVDSVLCVGAVNYDSTQATFSSQGPTYDNRIKPDVATLGDSCYFIQLNDTVNSGNGTSFATPLMSGMVACIKQAHPLRTNYEIMAAVRQSGHKNLNPDNIFGYGIPNACKIDSILTYLDTTSASIKEINTIKASFYPNPTNGILNIKTIHLLKHIKVINSLGQVIINKPINSYQINYQIDLTNLNYGNYFVEINTIDGYKLTKSVIKL